MTPAGPASQPQDRPVGHDLQGRRQSTTEQNNLIFLFTIESQRNQIAVKTDHQRVALRYKCMRQFLTAF